IRSSCRTSKAMRRRSLPARVRLPFSPPPARPSARRTSIARSPKAWNASVPSGQRHRRPVSAFAVFSARGPVGPSTRAGRSPETDVVRVAADLVAMGCSEISLGDTIGVGTAGQAQKMAEAVIGAIGLDKVAVHFHDTYGQALANVLACLELGVRVIDASVAGL